MTFQVSYFDSSTKYVKTSYMHKGYGVGLALLGYVKLFIPTITPERCLRLELGNDHGEDDQLAVVTLLAI